MKPAHDNIWFVLLTEQGRPVFYLDVSIVVIQNLCLRPVKFLRYLAWCILGVVGPQTSILFNDAPVDDDDNLIKHGTYYFSAPEMSEEYQHIDFLVLTSILGNFERIFEEKPDFEHIPVRDESHDPLEPYKFMEDETDGFRDELLRRDTPCIFTDWDRGNSTRIIQENELLQHVIKDRPTDPVINEDLSKLDLNDVRNGFVANAEMQQDFRMHLVSVLRTPNCVLIPEDIPTRAEHYVFPTDTYPVDHCYTLQWFEQNPAVMALTPNNSDAAFRSENQEALPSTHLLTFHYAVSAVKLWGRGWQELLSSLKHSARAPGTYRDTRSGIPSAKAIKAEGFHAADFLLLLCRYRAGSSSCSSSSLRRGCFAVASQTNVALLDRGSR